MKNKMKKYVTKTIFCVSILMTGIVNQTTAFAANINTSKLATGTEALISDLTTWLMILAPVVTVLLVIYYLIRKSASDEMESKKWNSRIVVSLVSCIGAVLASVIVNLLIGYYQCRFWQIMLFIVGI